MIFFSILAAVVLFGIMIFVHELGHFLAAKACGVRVNEFAIGMGPKLLSFGKKETKYSLRLLPLGGFCAMEGEDEASDDPKAFGNKKVWQRIVIVVSGVVMNFIFGYLMLLIAMGFFMPLSGDQVLFGTTVIAGHVEEPSPAYRSGLREGDTVLTVNGTAVADEAGFRAVLEADEDGAVSMTVLRTENGTEQTEELPEVSFDRRFADGAWQTVIDVELSGTTVKAFQSGVGPSHESGLRAGDRVESINGRPVIASNDIMILLQSDEDGVMPMRVRRTVDGTEQTVELPAVTFDFRTVNGVRQLIYDFQILGEEQTFWNTFSFAASSEVSLVTTTWGSLGDILTGRYGLNEISGPVGTMEIVGDMVSDAASSVSRESIYNLFFIIALISVNLGVMNLLPIPALDGGRLLFLVIEGIIRRPIPKKFEGMVHLIGFALLLLLMVVITFSDLVKLFGGSFG